MIEKNVPSPEDFKLHDIPPPLRNAREKVKRVAAEGKKNLAGKQILRPGRITALAALHCAQHDFTPPLSCARGRSSPARRRPPSRRHGRFFHRSGPTPAARSRW